jgi:heat shock protein HslJ
VRADGTMTAAGRATTAALALVLVLFLAGCDLLLPALPGAGDDPSVLDRNGWLLVDGVEAPTPDHAATLEFSGDGVSGTSFCNRFSGQALIGPGTIRFGPLATTRMGCENLVMEREQQYLDALGAVSRWRLDPNGALVLTGEGVLRFRPGPPARP